jgi:hypothetical protein
MKYVYKLTNEQAEQLKNIEYTTDMFFNPILDANNNYIISEEEVNATNINWVKELPKIEYIPIESTL